jgi:hypothetical protein
LAEPPTVAVNCIVPPEATVPLVGLMEIVTVGAAGSGFTVTFVVADLLASALLRAVTAKVAAEETEGAVNKPAAEIEPPVEVQVTPVLEDPVTVAVNCWVAPELSVGFCGATVTLTGAGGGVDPVEGRSPSRVT